MEGRFTQEFAGGMARPFAGFCANCGTGNNGVQAKTPNNIAK
jgi:hypothetical protein